MASVWVTALCLPLSSILFQLFISSTSVSTLLQISHQTGNIKVWKEIQLNLNQITTPKYLQQLCEKARYWINKEDWSNWVQNINFHYWVITNKWAENTINHGTCGLLLLLLFHWLYILGWDLPSSMSFHHFPLDCALILQFLPLSNFQVKHPPCVFNGY